MKRAFLEADLQDQIVELFSLYSAKEIEINAAENTELRQQYEQERQQLKLELLNLLDWSNLSSAERNQLAKLQLPENATATCKIILQLLQRNNAISSFLQKELRPPEIFPFFQFLHDDVKKEVASHLEFRTLSALCTAQSTYSNLFQPHAKVAALLKDVYELDYGAIKKKIAKDPMIMFEEGIYKDSKGFYEKISPLKLSVKILNRHIYKQIFHQQVLIKQCEKEFIHHIDGQPIFDAMMFFNHRSMFSKPSKKLKEVATVQEVLFNQYRHEFMLYTQTCKTTFKIDQIFVSDVSLLDFLCDLYTANNSALNQNALLEKLQHNFNKMSAEECNQLLSDSFPADSSFYVKQIAKLLKRNDSAAELVNEKLRDHSKNTWSHRLERLRW